MKFIRYEYFIKDSKRGDYTGSFTLKETADKTVVEKLNAHEVERFEY